jgi:hypothetical protein
MLLSWPIEILSKNFGAICFFLEKVIFQLGITIRLVGYLLWLGKI